MQSFSHSPIKTPLFDFGTRAYAEGEIWFSNISFSNLAEVLGLGKHEGLNAMMRMSGVEETLITGGASDYDKLNALAEVSPLWVGHPYVKAISGLMRALFGKAVPFDIENLPSLWMKATEALREEPITPRVLAKRLGIQKMMPALTSEVWMTLIDRDIFSEETLPCLHIPDPVSLWTAVPSFAVTQASATVDMSACMSAVMDTCARHGCSGVMVSLQGSEAFSRPNPYTPGQAVYRLQQGESLSLEDCRLVTSQTLRIIGRACMERGFTLTLTDVSPTVLTPLIRYLRGCDSLPKTTIVTSDPEAVLSEGLRPLLNIPSCAPLAGLTSLWADVASSMPIGRLEGLYMPLKGMLDVSLYASAVQHLNCWITEQS